jgi:NADPH:quinone reductase
MSMPKGMRIHSLGGPAVLRWEDVAVAPPAAGELQLRHTAVGLNFIDVYHRTGVYPIGLPAIIGSEAAGIVEAVGPGVSEFKVGERIAYAPVIGAYCEVRNLPADRAIPLPADISDAQAAGMMLKGMTARALVRRAYPVKRGDKVLVHAAAGGVGLILCQWAKSLGATILGTVGSDEKAALAAQNGCDHPILYRKTDFVAAVNDLTGGEGVQAVFDGVGKDTFLKSLQCMAAFGTIVSFGQASGRVEPFDIVKLRDKALYATRCSLAIHVTKRADLLASANDLFAAVQSGAVKIAVRRRYALADAVQAHRELEARSTDGSSILIP